MAGFLSAIAKLFHGDARGVFSQFGVALVLLAVTARLGPAGVEPRV